MTSSAPRRVRLRVDLFAYTLATLAFGWVMMNLLHGWLLDLYVQVGIVLVAAVLWTLIGSLGIYALNSAALRRFKSRESEGKGISHEQLG